MRIAHIKNPANVAWVLARAQRRLGHEAVVFSFEQNEFEFPHDVRIMAEGPIGWNVAMFSRWRTFADFDVLHVHSGIWKSKIFYRVFKRGYSWKTLAVHFHGGETRSGKGLYHLDAVDLQFHATPDLGPLLPKSVWVPNPIDIPEIPQEPDNKLPRFGHFPSQPGLKGTTLVVQLFRKVFGPLEEREENGIMRFRGKEAELLVVRRRSHDEALRLMRTCDAVIDQISPFRSYGMVSIEGMAFAKPAFSTFNPEWFPDCPVLPLESPETEELLRLVADDPDFRRRRGRLGRAYVERVHASEKVARRVLRAYYSVREKPALSPTEAVSYWRRRGLSYAKELDNPNAAARYKAQADEFVNILRDFAFHSVVEVGCGFGRIGRRIVDELGASWIGLDLSLGQLSEARYRNSSLKSSLVLGSAARLPLRNRAFDLVLASEVLMHVPPANVVRVMEELLRVSRNYVVHLDWYEDFITGHKEGYTWIHDYPRLWRSLGVELREVRLQSVPVQSVFIVTRTTEGGKVTSHGEFVGGSKA